MSSQPGTLIPRYTLPPPNVLPQHDYQDRQARLSPVAWRTGAFLAILVAGLLGIASQLVHIGFGSNLADMHASGSSFLRYQPGYSLQNGWLCYGWNNGAYHCTQHWHRDAAGHLVSDNLGWVPATANATTSAPTGQRTSAARPQNSVGSAGTLAQTGGQNTAGQPCHSSQMFVPNISQWTVPPSCYANVYTPNPANYVYRSSFGWCNWWPEVLHPGQPDILWGKGYVRSAVPTPGAAVFFAGGVQGASSAGHFAQVVAVAPDRYWVLVTEMNFHWRGAGFGRVNYRYIHVGPGVTFIHK